MKKSALFVKKSVSFFFLICKLHGIGYIVYFSCNSTDPHLKPLTKKIIVFYEKSALFVEKSVSFFFLICKLNGIGYIVYFS